MSINIIIMITMPPDSTLQLISWGRWAATLGAGIGLIVGSFEARSTEQAVQAERERVRAEEAKNKQELLEYLNTLLRHEVLNTTQIIYGRAEIAATECDEEDKIFGKMEEIKSNCRQMESVIKDVRLLLQASKSQLESEPTNIVDLLIAEIETLRSSHETVTVDTSLPEYAMANANEPLRRAFANILWNAVEHNDSEPPQIEVTVRRESDTVIVQIADNGPGIPTEDRDALFEQESRFDGNHGLGLALTHTLVNNYNGTIELTDTGPDGTLFTLTLPRAAESVHNQADADVQLASS